MLEGPGGLPVVCPTERLMDLGLAEWQIMARSGGPRPFAGGDHYHVTLPPLPHPLYVWLSILATRANRRGGTLDTLGR